MENPLMRRCATVSVVLALKGILTDTDGDGVADNSRSDPHGFSAGGEGGAPEASVVVTLTEAGRGATVDGVSVDIATLLGNDENYDANTGQTSLYDVTKLEADGLVQSAPIAFLSTLLSRFLAGCTMRLTYKLEDSERGMKVQCFNAAADKGFVWEIHTSVAGTTWSGDPSYNVDTGTYPDAEGSVIVFPLTFEPLTGNDVHVAFSAGGTLSTAVISSETGIVCAGLDASAFVAIQKIEIFPVQEDEDLEALES